MTKHRIPKSLAATLSAEAASVDTTGFTMGMPLHVLLGEAIDVARFCEHYWHATYDANTRALVRAGLEQAGNLSPSIAREIVVLHDLVQSAQTNYLLTTMPANDTLERARFVLDEIASAIEWVCNESANDENRAKLIAIVAEHRDAPDSEDALAAELADYVGLASELDAELARVGAFDAAVVAEGAALVLALRERSAARVRGRNSEAGRLLLRRNQLATLLLRRISRVRAAARYVFRHREDIVRLVTSAYQRRRRAAARRRASNDTLAPTAPPSHVDAPTSSGASTTASQ